MWSKRAMLHCSSWNKAPGFMTRWCLQRLSLFLNTCGRFFPESLGTPARVRSREELGLLLFFFSFFFSSSPHSDLHPEARRRLEIAQTCSTESKQNAVGVVSCKTSSAVPLISRDRGRCRTGARRRSRSAGRGSPQWSLPVEACGCVPREACVLLCCNSSPATCAHMYTKCHNILDAYLFPVMENNTCGARFSQTKSIFKPKTLTPWFTAAQKSVLYFLLFFSLPVQVYIKLTGAEGKSKCKSNRACCRLLCYMSRCQSWESALPV